MEKSQYPKESLTYLTIIKINGLCIIEEPLKELKGKLGIKRRQL